LLSLPVYLYIGDRRVYRVIVLVLILGGMYLGEWIAPF